MGETEGYITKGTRIRAHWFQVNDPPSSLAGMQMKFGVTERVVTGVVRHVRGDHPVTPTEVRFYIDPESPWDGATITPHGCTCGHSHVEINPKHVTGIVKPGSEPEGDAHEQGS